MNGETVVKVFVEEDCFACDRALSELEHLRTLHPQFKVKVYDRERDREQFEKFKVYAVPAIFINDELASYGSSIISELPERLGKKPTNNNKEVTVETKSLGRAVVAGLAGTAAMTIVMLMGPLMGMPEMNIGKMLGGFMGIPVALGWAAHFMIGTILALVYVYLFSSKLRGSSLLRGALYGLIPWFVSQIMVNPMMGAGIFASNTPAPVIMAMGSLMGHIIYGAVVGGIYGPCGRKHAVVATQN